MRNIEVKLQYQRHDGEGTHVTCSYSSENPVLVVEGIGLPDDPYTLGQELSPEEIPSGALLLVEDFDGSILDELRYVGYENVENIYDDPYFAEGAQ